MREPMQLALGGRSYKILFDKAAIYAFEDENLKRLGHERGIFQFMAEIGKLFEQALGRDAEARDARGPSFTEVALALWAATRTHHPNLPLEKLRGELEPGGYGSYVSLLTTAFAAAMPEQPKEEGEAAEGGTPLHHTPSSGG